jgi:anti-anti-sigma regulatory factor
VRMTIDAEWLDTEAADKVSSAAGEVVLDFSSVLRVDAKTVGSLERLADLADSKSVRVVLRAVRGDVYKVLKLLKLSDRFSFLN